MHAKRGTPDYDDEIPTPYYAVRPILKYLPAKATVWCPFDMAHSHYVRIFRANGHKVIRSHISEGKDFYEYEPKEKWDVMVSNPPFWNKRETVERALSFGKPFALLMTTKWLSDTSSKMVFLKADRDMQWLLFDRRIEFYTHTYPCGYLCCDFLPKQIIIERVRSGGLFLTD